MARWVSAFIAAALLMAGPALAADQGLAGVWAFKANDRILFLLTLDPGPGEGPPTSGVWLRPRHMTVSGDAASQVELPAVSLSVDVKPTGAGEARLTAHDPSKPGEGDVFDFRRTGPDQAELGLPGSPIPPMRLVRVGQEARIDPRWAEASAPASPQVQADNPEMTRIYEADQAARHDLRRIDWKTVSQDDAVRRAEVGVLLAQHRLQSADDFLHAGFVFQHGDTAGDFLLAHTLALVAMKEGSGQAAWLAAATLDRYLQAVGQPQIYGTQFRTQTGKPVDQEPYDRSLVSDELRQRLGVPDQASQEMQRKALEAPAKGP
jgi:hypothetical protein